MATKVKELKLDDAHATAVLEKAIEYESFTEEMPSSKRDRIKAATDQITLMIDAWVDDNVTPDNEDEDVAGMGQAIAEIFEIAGIEIDDEGEVSYGEPGDLDAAEDEDEDEDAEEEDGDDGDGDEAAIDIEDIIKGYEDMSAAGKVKAIKKLELDMEDDDDYNTAVSIYQWEESQGQPSSRVLQYLDDVIPQSNGAEDEDESEDAEDAEEDGDEDAAEGGEEGDWEEPWTKYDKMTAQDVKKHLDKMLADDELSDEMLQYVIDYETNREKPPTRVRVVKYADQLKKVLEASEEDGEEEEEAEEEAPTKRSGRPSAARTSRPRRGKPAEEDEDEDEDEDEESAKSNGTFTISGGDEEITANGFYQAAGAVADLLMQGVNSVTVEAD